MRQYSRHERDYRRSTPKRSPYQGLTTAYWIALLCARAVITVAIFALAFLVFAGLGLFSLLCTAISHCLHGSRPSR